jgi:transposase
LKKPFRKNYTPEEKVAILRRHLIEKESISDICDRYQLQPTVFHRWLKEFFENGAAAFESNKPKKQDRQEQRIEKLEEKLKKKDEVLAELMEEYVIVKKSLGEI